jgi:Predicted membrane protein
MKPWQIAVLAYFAVMTVIGFAAMYRDKKKAEKKKWRTPEAALFALSLIGGSLGTFLGMWVMRHKNRHWYFVVGFTLILAAHIALVLYLMNM